MLPRRDTRGAIAVVLMFGLLVGACRQPDDGAVAPVPADVEATAAVDPVLPDAPTVDPTIAAPTEEMPVITNGIGGNETAADETLLAIIARARHELATELEIEEREVEVVSWEQVTWSDGALGCPEPGQFYIQQIIVGYRIVLEGAGQVRTYHSDDRPDGTLVHCPGPLEE